MSNFSANRKVKQPRLLKVGEVAKRSGVAVSTLHFYESKGVISSLRTSANQRRYMPGVLRYISIIKVAQRAGISLDEIKQAPSNGARWLWLLPRWGHVDIGATGVGKRTQESTAEIEAMIT